MAPIEKAKQDREKKAAEIRSALRDAEHKLNEVCDCSKKDKGVFSLLPCFVVTLFCCLCLISLFIPRIKTYIR